MEDKRGYQIFVNINEFQQMVLNYIHSNEFNKMFASTVFTGDERCRAAMIHGMSIASMLTSQCKPVCIKEQVSKIKVTSAEIVVHGTSDKPYYEVKYFDISDGEYHIGYGSYDLKNVFQWINECFEIVDTDVIR